MNKLRRNSTLRYGLEEEICVQVGVDGMSDVPEGRGGGVQSRMEA